MTNAAGRVADYPIDPMFLARWSPRAFFAPTDLTKRSDDNARSSAMGTVVLQRLAMALRVRPPGDGVLGFVPRSSGPEEPGVGASCLGISIRSFKVNHAADRPRPRCTIDNVCARCGRRVRLHGPASLSDGMACLWNGRV